MISSRLISYAAGLIVPIFLLIPVPVQAQIQTATIKACFNQSNGFLRILNRSGSSRSCSSQQRFITWTAATQHINPGDLTVNVNCAWISGSISGVLQYYKATPGKLLINVQGMCAERIDLPRSNVHFRGSDTSGENGLDVTGLLPDGNGAIIISGKTDIIVEGLRVQGELDGNGISASMNSSVQLNEIEISGFDPAIKSSQGAQVEMNSSVINSARNGVYATTNSGMAINSSTISNSIITGVRGDRNAVVVMTESLVSDNNGDGVQVDTGGVFDMSDSEVKFNGGSGVVMSNMAVLRAVNSNIESNSAFGIACTGSVSISLEEVNVIFNNFGDISVNCP